MEAEASCRPGYQIFMLALCMYALGVMGAETFISLDPDTRSVIAYADNFVCALFLVDFLKNLYQAENKIRYLGTWGWIDLASSIPTVDVLRWGRAARLLRIFRVLRGLRATKLIATLILERRSESAFLAASLVSTLLIVFSAMAILQFETLPESNIKSAEDALWWAFVTITTVGYGDKFPLSWEGRIVAGILMVAGVGLFGTFSGFVASWFIAPKEDKRLSEMQSLREEVFKLRTALEDHSQSSKT
jgi:voltage-gated potassium channel